MLNHSHSRPDSRCAPFLHHGLTHAAAAADTDHHHHHRGAAQPQPQQQQERGMDPPSSSGRSTPTSAPTTPRRQLQGPRPPRLNVRMESHAIKKQPSASSSAVPPGALAAPAAQGRLHPQLQQQPGPARAPVIIYDASPKVIHAKPSEFMALVQRLTGPGGGSVPGDAQAPPPPLPPQPPYETDDGASSLLGQAFLPPELLLSPSAAMSPAARLATIERSVRGPTPAATDYDVIDVQGSRGADVDGTLAAVLGPAALSRHPGVLSPLPSTLPPAAASGLFSPLPFDASGISWLNELSPILRAAAAAGASSSGAFGTFSGPGTGGTSNGGGSRPPPPAYYSDPFVPSPRHLLATPTVPSPATCAEFFGSLPDL